jgi:hypothetical protein
MQLRRDQILEAQGFEDNELELGSYGQWGIPNTFEQGRRWPDFCAQVRWENGSDKKETGKVITQLEYDIIRTESREKRGLWDFCKWGWSVWCRREKDGEVGPNLICKTVCFFSVWEVKTLCGHYSCNQSQAWLVMPPMTRAPPYGLFK